MKLIIIKTISKKIFITNWLKMSWGRESLIT